MIPAFIFNTKPSDYFKDNSIFIFHHIHKVGGTSLENVFSKWFFYKREFDLASESKVSNYKNFMATGGHYGYKGLPLDKKYPFVFDEEKYKVVTYLRDPFNRAVSHYYHWKKQGYFKSYEDLTLSEFITGKAPADWVNNTTQNWSSKMLGVDRKNYKEILNKYYFVGIFEHLQLSTDILAKKLHKPKIDLPHLRNTNQKRINEKLSKEEMDIFRKRNEVDYLLYNYAFKNFEFQHLNLES